MLDPSDESASERLGVSEGHHVPGALDHRVLPVRDASPDDVADRMVDRGGPRSFDDVKRRGHPGEDFGCEQAIVKEDIP